MARILLDTDVLSFLFRDEDPTGFYRPALHGHEVFVSFVAIAEIAQGAFFKGWSDERRERTLAFARSYGVIGWDEDVAVEWGRVRAERKHRTIPELDAWVAATARVHGLMLATHNSRDFEGVEGLELLTAPAAPPRDVPGGRLPPPSHKRKNPQ